MANSTDDDQEFKGFLIPSGFNLETFRSAINYKARPDDVFIATFPKCGTTWTGQIVSLILRHGKPLEPGEFFSTTPFLEMTGAKAAEEMPRPGAIKLHLPYRLTPRSDQAKYIYVTRNPKDTCVSYYYHQKNLPFKPAGTFDEIFETFLNGTNHYGDFFDHLLDWYAHRNEPNVLILTYEELKEDPEAAVMKLASFIDDEKYAEPLRQDPEKLQNVLKYSSLKHMKETINKEMGQVFTMSQEELDKSKLPEGIKKTVSVRLQQAKGSETDSESKPDGSNFVRKGIIGDWKNHLSEDQSRRLDEKCAEKLKGTEFLTIWKKYM